MKIDREKVAGNLKKAKKADLIKSLRAVGITGVSGLNKTKLINKTMDAMEEGKFDNYDADKVILEIREALGLSTHGNVKNRTQGLRKSKVDDAKSAKQLASESLALVKEALAMTNRKPKLRKQFINRMKKELDDFEIEIKEMTAGTPR
jgi:hypothetical protein